MQPKKKSEFAKQTTGDKILLVICYCILGAFVIAIVFPIIYIILSSFIDPVTLQNKGVTFDFSQWTLTAYERVMSNAQIWVGFKNALIYSIVATILGGVITLLAAYPMSRPDFRGKGFFNVIFLITMFFGGGLIPTYLVVQSCHLINTWWSLILPGSISVYNMTVARTFFKTNIPEELYEAASIDGCTQGRFFFQIALPLSGAITAILVLYYGIGHWNSYFSALIYITNRDKWPLQMVLRSILITNETALQQTANTPEARAAMNAKKEMIELMKYSLIIISSLPTLILYPFIQKHFVKGVMVGSVKG